MADVIILEDDIEYNVHNASADSVNNANSTISSSSADTLLVLTRNRLLRNACKDLLSTFHYYKETMEELIEKPVEILEKQTNNFIPADKASLKLSEKILKQAVCLLKEGVKTMKKAMTEHSHKIEELCNYEDCSNSNSSGVIFENFKTAKENEVSYEIYGYENTSSIGSSDTDVTCQQDECLCLKDQPRGHRWKCTDFSSDESTIDYCIDESSSDVSTDDPIFTELYHASFEDCTPVNGEKIRHVFTDWGPFVEELVDVFEDIACLPDEVNPFSNRIDCRTIFKIFV